MGLFKESLTCWFLGPVCRSGYLLGGTAPNYRHSVFLERSPGYWQTTNTENVAPRVSCEGSSTQRVGDDVALVHYDPLLSCAGLRGPSIHPPAVGRNEVVCQEILPSICS